MFQRSLKDISTNFSLKLDLLEEKGRRGRNLFWQKMVKCGQVFKESFISGKLQDY
jgi:hypothetical protein